MTRVYIFCEGQTEETFVRELLQPHFGNIGITVTPILARTGKGKGGIVSYGKIRRHIDLLCKQDQRACVTTFMDYYAFPQGKNGLAPLCDSSDPIQKALALTKAFQEDIGHKNFIANLIVHEFEGLLFSQPKAFEQWFDEDITRKLQTIRNDAPSPEHINDNKQTAPSKRILQICEGYSKVWHGPLIALDIGLNTIRKECPVFHAWLEKIENLGDSA